MVVVVAENPTTAEQIRFRRPKNQPITAPDPTPQISSTNQCTRGKTSISSLFLSTFTSNNNSKKKGSDMSSALKDKKKSFTSATFRGLGCTSTSQVSAPEAIRSSADWQAKKVRKKKQRNTQRKKSHHVTETTSMGNPTPVVVVPDVWCSPGIGFAADAAPIDCVVSRRPVAGRGRIDGERINHRERPCNARRTAPLEQITVLDSPPTFEMRSGSDVFGARHYRHFRYRSPGGLTEIMMFQSLLLSGRSDVYDQYRDWRLDVDNMTYEELLELGDRIGYVNTGLREDEIFRCLRKIKHSFMDDLQSHIPTETDRKCSICQEEYEADDEVGKLDCGHDYHVFCIKQWLLQKNACPVCKAAVSVQY
ncbi:PREDICTED: uncharacterized protein LOC104602578 [Nelumbo nucifera]|uniref:RING-type E3 ubiquitin transferase n=1 Tax=Nelumbo nucifera TaxID=4432 RepID=A0A1U8AQL4_NELNU|nr:PREDICTED: uncharacterized protein LOC104602578 [Nelumbo nucifera]